MKSTLHNALLLQEALPKHRLLSASWALGEAGAGFPALGNRRRAA